MVTAKHVLNLQNCFCYQWI